MYDGSIDLINEFKEREIKLNKLLGNLPGVVFSSLNEKNKTMIFMSAGAAKLTGFENDQLLYNRYNDIIHKEDRDRCWKEISEKISNNEEYQVVYRITTATFEEKWVFEQGVGVEHVCDEENGHDRGAFVIEGFIIDITNLVRNNLISVNI